MTSRWDDSLTKRIYSALHPSHQAVAGLVALLASVTLVYWPGLDGGFVFDDYPNIVDNTALHVSWHSSWQEWLAASFSSHSSDLQRPLAMLTFAINHAFGGLDPFWMKFTNLLIHLLNTTLVFALIRLLSRAMKITHPADPAPDQNWFALWVAAIWALNPINLMAVLFVVQRMESLSHTFVFAGLLLYLLGRMHLRSNSGGWGLILAGLGATGIGLLAKESAVLLPAYAFAIEWALLAFAGVRNKPDQRLIMLFGAILFLPALLGLAWMIPKVTAENSFVGRNFDLWERLLTEGRVLVDYMHWTLLPNLSHLSLYHDDYPVSRGLLDPPSTLLALAALASLIGMMLWIRKQRPLLALGLAWFFCAHLLTATIWPLELVFEHRNYFASLGLCLALADLLFLALPSLNMRRVGLITATALLGLYAGTTALRSLEWNNPLRFDLSEASKHPNSARATYELARSYAILSESDPEYIDKAFAALERARMVPGASTLPESTAIKLSARLNRNIDPHWWTSLQEKLRSRPLRSEDISSLVALATCIPEKDCRLPAAPMVTTFHAALSQHRHPEVLNNFASYALKALHDPTAALSLWQEAARRAPKVPQYQESLARMLIALGEPDLAAAPIARLRELGRLGQNEAIAEELEQLAQTSRRSRTPPKK